MTAERPPHAVAHPATLQTWESLSFLHWAYPVDAVRACVPDDLEIQTAQGSAWVGVVAFRMRAARPGLARRPGIFGRLGTFPEINVRTYVDGPDGPGIWFLALEVTNAGFAAAARALALPYNWAAMSLVVDGGTVAYRTRRRPPHSEPAAAEFSVDVGSPIPDEQIGSFENFLASRWRAYHGAGPVRMVTRVEHEPWGLREGSFRGEVAPLLQAAGLPAPDGEPVVHYSEGVDVRLAPPRVIQRGPWTGRASRDS